MLWESDLPIEDIKRYSRQIILQKVKIDGQKALDNTRVLIVGMGGLGSPVLMYLATTGIRNIGIVDFDHVELHNLQRQVIHKERNVDKPKTKSAKEFIQELNSSIQVTEHNVYCTKDNIMHIIQNYDVVADCCDDIQLRYILNDACRIMSKDLVSASVLKWEGQICVIPKNGACYRCMFPNMKTSASNCASSGVMGPVCGIIGSMQANEIVKLILSNQSTENEFDRRIGQLIIFNGLTNTNKIFTKAYKQCEVCITNKMGVVNFKNCPAPSKYGDITILPWSTIVSNLDKYKIVDVRTNDQFNMFRVTGSVNIPEVEKSLEVIQGFDKPIVVSCYRGFSSVDAAKFLKDKGITAYTSDGGIEKFKEFVGFKDL